jgi:hypothetical protein
MDLAECSEPVGATMTVSGLTCNRYRVRLPHSDLGAERSRRCAELLAPAKSRLSMSPETAPGEPLERITLKRSWHNVACLNPFQRGAAEAVLDRAKPVHKRKKKGRDNDEPSPLRRDARIADRSAGVLAEEVGQIRRAILAKTCRENK